MGNVIGEGFRPEVRQQVLTRQKIFGLANRNNEYLRYLNARSPWIKLSSAVTIGTDRLSQVGLSADLSADALAQNYVLFGGTATNFGSTLRGGLTDAYNVGDFSQGYRPMPGIVSMESKNRNRGSIRETTIQIKAYDKQQFNIIDLLYLRLGYTVLVEWGHSIYVNNAGDVVDINDSDTLTRNFLSGTYKDQKALSEAINSNKLKLQGNYDATYGRITNFSWSYEKDGSYSITLNVVSLGDIIESLKVNTIAKGVKPQTAEEKKETEENIQEADTESDILTYAKNQNAIAYTFYKAKSYLQGFNPDTNQQVGAGFSQAGEGDQTMNIMTAATAESLGFKEGDFVSFTEYTNIDEGRFYVRLGGFLEFLKTQKLVYNNGIPLIDVDTDENTNIIFTTPYVLSSDPKTCIVKTVIKMDTEDLSVFPALPKDFKTEIAGVTVGKLMNVYINLVYIVKAMDELKDDQNKVSWFDIVKKLCDGVNSSLGNVNKIAPAIDEENNNRVFLLDETALPNRDKIINTISPNTSTKPTLFQVYGYKENNSSFVLDLGIKTEITNNLASMLTIGAQAQGQAVGEDATAFSKWNENILDRIIPKKETNATGSNDIVTEDVNTNYENIVQEYSNFITQMVSQKFDDSIDTFPETLSNYLEFMQAQESVTKKTSSPTVGFIPINLNLTIVGLSGMKIYQKFSINNEFLPANYPQTIEFLIKGLSQKVDTSGWTTSIESLSIPASDVTSQGANPKTSYTKPALTTGESSAVGNPGPAGAAPTTANAAEVATAQGALSGITPGKCGTKFITFNVPGLDNPTSTQRKTALQKGYNATFYSGQYKSGMCSRYTYNHAYNYIQSLQGKNTRNGATLAAGGNANQPSYWANLSKLGYTQYVVGKNVTKNELINLINSKLTYNLGDVIVYWANNNPRDKGASQYGHTQMYVGKGNIQEKSDAPKGKAGWTTDRFTNYGSTFVYNSSSYNCWNLIIFRAPSSGTNPQNNTSRQLYVTYAKELAKVLNLADKTYRKNGTALLSDAKGTLSDNTQLAINHINELFGLSRTSQSWYNKLPLSSLSPEHQKLFTSELKRLYTSIKDKDNNFEFKIPDSVNPTIYQTAEAFKKQNNLKTTVSQSTIDIIMKPDF